MHLAPRMEIGMSGAAAQPPSLFLSVLSILCISSSARRLPLQERRGKRRGCCFYRSLAFALVSSPPSPSAALSSLPPPSPSLSKPCGLPAKSHSALSEAKRRPSSSSAPLNSKDSKRGRLACLSLELSAPVSFVLEETVGTARGHSVVCARACVCVCVMTRRGPA